MRRSTSPSGADRAALREVDEEIAGILVAVWLGERRWVARGGKPGQVSDIAIWAVLAKTTESQVCLTCHKGQRADFQKPSTHPVRYGLMSCTGCHSAHGRTGGGSDSLCQRHGGRALFHAIFAGSARKNCRTAQTFCRTAGIGS